MILIFQAKGHIRQLLPQGLSESISKVRSSIAYAISAIAHWDWPELWPELFPLLMQALSSGQPNAVHGAMRVLSGIYYTYTLLLAYFNWSQKYRISLIDSYTLTHL